MGRYKFSWNNIHSESEFLERLKISEESGRCGEIDLVAELMYWSGDNLYNTFVTFYKADDSDEIVYLFDVQEWDRHIGWFEDIEDSIVWFKDDAEYLYQNLKTIMLNYTKKYVR